MKTSIKITGQISGNFNLLNKLRTSESDEKKLPHNNFILTYPTKKDAVKALSEARQRIQEEEPEYVKESSMFSYMRGFAISYDSSRAEIIEN